MAYLSFSIERVYDRVWRMILLLATHFVAEGSWSVSGWVDELEKECALKPDAQRKPIGFVT